MSYYRFNVVGSTFDNKDGTSRQHILEASADEQTGYLLRDPDNEHDSNAFAIATSYGLIGFLPAEIAAEISPSVDGRVTRYVISLIRIKQFETDDDQLIWIADAVIETRSLKTGQTEYLQNWLPIKQVENLETHKENTPAIFTIITLAIAVIIAMFLLW